MALQQLSWPWMMAVGKTEEKQMIESITRGWEEAWMRYARNNQIMRLLGEDPKAMWGSAWLNLSQRDATVKVDGN